MVSTVKVDVVAPRVATGTTTLGVSGDKLVIPSGVTFTNSGTATGFASGFHQQLVYTASTSAGGYSPATDVTKIMVEILGAGGAGSRYTSDGPKVNGGAGGGYIRKVLTVVSTDTMTVTIGAAGTHTGNTNEAGSNGGSTSFATASGTSFTTLTAGGGGGGSISNYTPGVSGTATGGDLNIIGDAGRTMNVGSSTGGQSPYGYGGSARTNEATSLGANGIGYGSGGGGGADNGYAGNGAAGLCIITEYK